MTRRTVALTALAGVLLTAGCATTTDTPKLTTGPAENADPPVVFDEVAWTGTMTAWDDLPLIGHDAETVIPGLPVDPDPDGDTTDLRVEVYAEVPVWDVPLPDMTDTDAGHVARLAPWTVQSETVLPVLEVTDDHGWGLVPLMARAGLPSDGVTGQAVGWIRLTDPTVRVTTDDRRVEVDTTTGTLTVHAGDDVVHQAQVATGLPGNETAAGRTGIVAAFTDPAAPYADGELIALARYSDDITNFTPIGADSPVAPLLGFHTWYDGEPTGQVSNGCVRVDPDTHSVLTDLPIGTPVVIR